MMRVRRPPRTAESFRERAEKHRKLAEEAPDPQVRDQLLLIAETYDELCEIAVLDRPADRK
jgi:hypothetical protein